MAEALIALGGNVGNVRDTLDRAIAAFCDGVAVRLLKRSSDYRTPPVGVTDQPPFVNCAIVAATELPPPALLARAQSVEAQLGRNRSQERHWGPRTLDIDLLAFLEKTEGFGPFLAEELERFALSNDFAGISATVGFMAGYLRT